MPKKTTKMSASHIKASKLPGISDSQNDAKVEVSQNEDHGTELPNNSKKFRKPANRSIGPIRIMITDGNTYRVSVLLSFLAIMTHLSLGAVNIMVLGYTIKTGDLHAILCTIGWHLFNVEAVMALAYRYTWSTLFHEHRRIVHYFLNMCGLILVVCGGTISLVNSGVTKSLHCIFGLTAFVATIVTVFIRPIVIFTRNKLWNKVHVCFAIVTLISSAVCLILAILLSVFKEYCGDPIAICLVVIISLYTFTLVIVAILKSCMQVKYL